MTLRLYLVRHGETDWSRSGRHTGLSDIPLTVHGEAEARQLRPTLEHVDFAAVFTSPLLRARRTCELAGLGSTAEIEPDLAEWHYGDYEGQRTVGIRSGRPGWNVFRDGCPGGEMPAQIQDRADRLIRRLDSNDGNIALFSHGQFGSVFGARWIGLPERDGQHLSLGPASLSILSYDRDHPDVRVIVLWNECASKLHSDADMPAAVGHSSSSSRDQAPGQHVQGRDRI